MIAWLVAILLLAVGNGLVFFPGSPMRKAVGLVVLGVALGFAFGMAAADTWGWPA